MNSAKVIAARDWLEEIDGLWLICQNRICQIRIRLIKTLSPFFRYYFQSFPKSRISQMNDQTKIDKLLRIHLILLLLEWAQKQVFDIQKFFGKQILKSWSDFLRKFNFTDSNIKVTSHIDVGILKCLNFLILQRNWKNDAAYAFASPKIQKKAEKCVFSSQG